MQSRQINDYEICVFQLITFVFLALWQVSCGQGGEKLLGLAEGLLKKHIASHSLHEPEGLYGIPFLMSE